MVCFHYNSTTWNSSGTGNPLRREVQQRSQYFEGDSDSFEEDDDDDEAEQSISISSRGRVRKISSKVRGYFRE